MRILTAVPLVAAVLAAASLAPAGAADAAGVGAEHARVTVTMPLHPGLHDGGQVLYIITDASDEAWAGLISERQGWNVQLAAPLSNIDREALNTVYVFANGPDGTGLKGHQPEVFEHAPGSAQYAALSRVVEITWLTEPEALGSSADVAGAVSDGRAAANDTGAVVNAPQVAWPGGQMDLSEDIGAAGTAYGGGQITEMDPDGMTVTFVAHPALGPGGQPVHYILAGAASPDTARVLGVAHSPPLMSIGGNHTSDMFLFVDGQPGAGYSGFHLEVVAAIPGNDTYTPAWRTYNVTWGGSSNATALTTPDEIELHRDRGSVSVLGAGGALNAPIIDPFQNVVTVLGGVDLSGASPLLGDAGAPVTIIEFGDYQCPKCGSWFDNTKPAVDANYIQTGRANLYFLDLVFIGSDSSTAAAATYCAQEQGMYWDMHDALFRNQGGIQDGWAARDGVVGFARDLGLDVAEFEACLDMDHAERIQFNEDQAWSVGFRHTPSFVVVGPGGIEKISGNQPYAAFKWAIEKVSG